MFDRLRNTPKDRGAPLNRKKLEAWQNSRQQQQQQQQQKQSSSTDRGVKGGDSQYQYSIRGGGPPPPRPPRDPNPPPERHQNRQHLQPAPPSAHAPNPYRNSAYGRPVSSIYSQPSPDAATFAAQQLRLEVPHNDPNEISPPSSPDALSPRDEPNPGDVSPIDDIPDMSQLAVDPQAQSKSNIRTNIPTMRRERRKNSDAAQNALRESKSREKLKQQRPYGHDVRWDPNTGEPTTDAKKGRPSQVNPQEFVQGLGIRPGSESPPQAKQAPNTHISFGDRLRRIRQPSGSPQPEQAPRPEWRGASGRTTLVAPVNDNKEVAPLKVPRKSSKRAGRSPGDLSPINSVDSRQAPQPQSPASPSIRVTKPGDKPSTYPSPPLSDDSMAPARNSPAPQGQQLQQSLQIPANDKAIRRKPAGHNPHQSTSSSVYSHQDPHAAQAVLDTSPDGWTQPPSRFSVTTYATSSHQSSDPRDSVDEDVPPVPTNSILDRKRPVVSGFDDGASSISRKSTPATEPVKISLDSPYYMTSGAPSSTKPSSGAVPRGNLAKHDNASRLSLASLADKDKSLPPAPPETQSLHAQDRVAQLDARVRALGNRRININTAIKQMTELMPTDHILASEAVARRREEEKRKVEALRLELAEVERESYELGLKLHRAYKRMDREAEYEPTGLWVRRVTGA